MKESLAPLVLVAVLVGVPSPVPVWVPERVGDTVREPDLERLTRVGAAVTLLEAVPVRLGVPVEGGLSVAVAVSVDDAVTVAVCEEVIDEEMVAVFVDVVEAVRVTAGDTVTVAVSLALLVALAVMLAVLLVDLELVAVAVELRVTDELRVDVWELVAVIDTSVAEGVVVADSLGEAPSLRVAVGLALLLGRAPTDRVAVTLGVKEGVVLGVGLRVPVPE